MVFAMHSCRILVRFAALVLLPGLLLAILLASILASGAKAQNNQQTQSDQNMQPLVADLSKHLVAITTGFSGTDVLLFGATDGPGDVVLVVRGPTTAQIIRKKDRLGGMIWVNKDSVTFEDAPAFYWLAANRPIEEFTTKAILERHQIGTQNLRLTLNSDIELTGETEHAFTQALIRLKDSQDLYGEDQTAVKMLANRLFRAQLHFPANVPVGTYMVEAYLIRDNQVVSAEITPLNISKVGVGADIYDFAHDQAAIYGIAAILIAIFAGWLAGVAFRKT